VQLLIDKIKVNLDFHIFDVLDIDLLLGSRVEKLLDASRGSPDEKLREVASATTPLLSETSMAKPIPNKNPVKEMRRVSLFASSEPVVIEVVEVSTPQEYDFEDPLHFCEGERSSSPSIEFEPLPTGPYHLVLDLDRESTSSFHDASLEMEKSWAMEIYETSTLEFKGKDSIDEHGSFTHDIPSRPCLYHASPESVMLSALSTHEGYNNLMVLSCKQFRRMVVDVYVYHKHCYGTNLAAEASLYIYNWW
jgi:hypothetical protein